MRRVLLASGEAKGDEGEDGDVGDVGDVGDGGDVGDVVGDGDLSEGEGGSLRPRRARAARAWLTLDTG